MTNEQEERLMKAAYDYRNALLPDDASVAWWALRDVVNDLMLAARSNALETLVDRINSGDIV